jgi:soluble lytic murein transglycosylase-like protein
MLKLLRPLAIAGSVIALVVASQASLSGRLNRKPAAGVPTYVVKRGDSLSSIAKRFALTPQELAKANDIPNLHKVYVGEVLALPAVKPVPVPAPSPKLPAALRAHPERLALMPAFDRWATTYGVPSDLLKALAWMESGWQNHVVSVVSARGIGQLTPATVEFVCDRLLKTKLDPAVPEENIRMSARYLSYLLGRAGGDVSIALAAYYQGFASVQKFGVKPVSKLYIDDVLALRPMFT